MIQYLDTVFAKKIWQIKWTFAKQLSCPSLSPKPLFFIVQAQPSKFPREQYHMDHQAESQFSQFSNSFAIISISWVKSSHDAHHFYNVEREPSLRGEG